MSLSEAQIRRYSRHILLPDVGGTGQARLLAATVSIDLAADPPAAIAAATYLAAAGVGTLVLTGGARSVSETDLRTGIALGHADLGRPLVTALADRLRALNPDVQISDNLAAVSYTASDLRFESGSPGGLAEALVRAGREVTRIVHAIATGAA